MHGWIALWLAAAPAWGEFPAARNARLNPEPPAGSVERVAAADAMQRALAQWDRERREAARERERLQELRAERATLDAEKEGAPAPEVERGPVRAGARTRAGPKVIEVAPEPTRAESEGWLEAEVKRRRAEQEGKGKQGAAAEAKGTSGQADAGTKAP